MPHREDFMGEFKYQALLISGLLKDKGFYALEPYPVPDGLILFFSGSSPTILFHYLGESSYRLKIWEGQRGWRGTSNYGSINHLVEILADKYRYRCQVWLRVP